MRPPSNSGLNKLDTKWLGPNKILARVGEQSYKILIKPGWSRDVHASQLKVFVEDVVEGKHIDLFHFPTTHEEMEAETDEWIVENILQHRIGKNNKLEFLTK